MAQTAAEYAWSSARVHCGDAEDDGLLDLETWRELWAPRAWRDFLNERQAAESDDEIRRCTHTGRPLGGPRFVTELETLLRRRLAPSEGGTPPQARARLQQTTLPF